MTEQCPLLVCLSRINNFLTTVETCIIICNLIIHEPQTPMKTLKKSEIWFVVITG